VSRRTYTIAAVVAVAAVLAAALLLGARDAIAERMFMRSGRQLEAALGPDLQKKYGNDLQYTLKTFWKFYDRGLVGRNDLNDVMDKMKTLRGRDSIAEMEIFDFIGYVSRLYTEAMNRSQSETFPE
jgi:hypothetical protein